ncbi:MAG TPA: GspH/FimT family pseudopilin [Steroidobacteraceae bacterium]
MPRKECRGFTLIELIASITIIAILGAVAWPRLSSSSQPYAERGYADGVAASLRQARAVAIASGCDVRFTITAAGYNAFQRGAAANNHCAVAGAWVTPVQRGDGQSLLAMAPAGAALAVNRQFVFGADGSVVGGAVNITIGPQVIDVNASGVAYGP